MIFIGRTRRLLLGRWYVCFLSEIDHLREPTTEHLYVDVYHSWHIRTCKHLQVRKRRHNPARFVWEGHRWASAVRSLHISERYVATSSPCPLILKARLFWHLGLTKLCRCLLRHALVGRMYSCEKHRLLERAQEWWPFCINRKASRAGWGH